MSKRLLFTVIMICTAASLLAYNDEPACFKELKTSFFQTNLVYEALSMHNVAQNQWPVITQKLQLRSKWVPAMVKERADRMRPNPLDYPFNPLQADEILSQVLLEIFYQVLHESWSNANPYNDNDIKNMFRYIRTQQKDRLKACLTVSDNPATNKK